MWNFSTTYLFVSHFPYFFTCLFRISSFNFYPNTKLLWHWFIQKPQVICGVWNNSSTYILTEKNKDEFLWSDVKWSRSIVSDSLRPLDCSLWGSSIHGIFQARVLEWGCQLNQSRWTQNSMSSYISKECLAFLLKISIHSTNIYLAATTYRLMGGYESTWQGIFYFNSNTRETAIKYLKAKNS